MDVTEGNFPCGAPIINIGSAGSVSLPGAWCFLRCFHQTSPGVCANWRRESHMFWYKGGYGTISSCRLNH